MAVTVTGVEPGSPAARAGVRAGDTLLKIGRSPIRDVLDYRFYLVQEQCWLTVRRGERLMSFHVKKGEYEDLGLTFATYLMDEQRSCRNNCVFCFIDQNPKGMRDTVYFKDDDARLSFLFGNYITLTNLADEDIDRILAMHISPVNVSVHTTNPALRERMMRNRFAGEASLARLRRLCAGGVRVNTQLVLCPGWNDGDELSRTLSDLGALWPALQSVACVPVGLTGHREGLTPLRPFTKEEAAAVIDTVESFAEQWLAARGDRIAYPADEFFLRAQRPVPAPDYYGDFAQLENGVGLIANCRLEFEAALREIAPCGLARRITLATGRAAAPSIGALAKRAAALDPALDVTVRAVPSRFFGGQITVTGLVTGSDLIAELGGQELGDFVLLADCMLRHEKDRFLDDLTIPDLTAALGVPVLCSEATGGALAHALLDPPPIGMQRK